MSHRPPDLSRKQERALAALLTASTLQQASEQAGVSLRTLHRWMQDAAFRRHYATLRRSAVSQAMARVQQASVEGVDALRACLKARKSPWMARVKAASKLLDLAHNTLKTDDILARLDALERPQQPGRPVPVVRVIA